MNHCSTTEQRVEWISELLAHPEQRGLLSERSRQSHITRQTLYRWKAKGEGALHECLQPQPAASKRTPIIERAVLTLLVEGHASYRGIQGCLQELLGVEVSLGTISAIVQSAGQQAQRWLEKLAPVTECALALDEQYSSTRGQAYLNVVDVHSSLVWASVPPVAVDGESWTLVLWYLQEQGLHWQTTVSDGGRAIAEALSQTKALESHQRDVWHLFHLAAQVQGRVERYRSQLQDQLATVKQQAERVAQGQKARGRAPKSDVQAHLAQLEHSRIVDEGVAYLFSELHHLLEVVVPASRPADGILDSRRRQSEVETVLVLLSELQQDTPPALQRELQRVQTYVQLALPQVLLFAQRLDAVQQQTTAQLGAQAMHLMAWAWQRRQILGPSTKALLAGFHPAWQQIAQPLLHAWNWAVRASSAVENWHSILRPHLSVHRTLSAEMLALLAVWHNSRIAPRGLHAGLSPLQRSGFDSQETDWLLTLGYPPRAA